MLNPLAFKYESRGTERGHLSADIIKKSDMMYNRDNFRDVYRDKPKGVSRQEWLVQHPEINRRDGYFEQMMARSKKTLRNYIDKTRDGQSELTQFIEEQTDTERATQMHHIFPKNEFPEIRHYIENLIALTPNQHLVYAHPDNNMQCVDPAAQKILLIAKTYSIRENLAYEKNDPIYEFSNLLEVLSTGWDDKDVLDIEEGDFADVFHSINYHYNTA